MCRDCYRLQIDPQFMPLLHPQRKEFDLEESFWDIIFGDDDTGARAKNEPALVETLVRGGNKDENDLTNQLFFKRHPELGGKKLQPSQTGFEALSQEWLRIRDGIVRPKIRRIAPQTVANYELDSFLKRTRMLIPFIEKDRGPIPLSFVLAWIKIESDGDITVVPKYKPGTKDLDERGYFQISVEESPKARVPALATKL